MAHSFMGKENGTQENGTHFLIGKVGLDFKEKENVKSFVGKKSRTRFI